MWTFCIIFFGVLTFAWIPITGRRRDDYSWNCELEVTYNFEFQLFIIALFFVFPLVTIACLNIIVYRNIRERSKGFVRSKPVATSASKEPISASNSSVNQEQIDDDGTNNSLKKGTSDLSLISLRVQKNDSKGASVKTARKTEKSFVDKKHKEFNRHRKAAITLAVLVGVFILCWLPFYITSLLGTLCEICVPELAWEITSNLLWCNSTINPFLYAAMNLYFRENFIKLLGLKRCLKKHSEPLTSSTEG
ncbi:LOW QUALITY PROTEIN: uncharacterized protein [Amphiura filiformis]|uniref:LOW QUALITY PROTEIN: uncharacterized protein n=1 Tax=Amphiura filiformis TaxID=82378 RepID=UPI003B22479D